ncbi:hypothetical protein KC326_g50 [Hortaea werneckii]|nr:hypothetical protein KC326_g50 [Hortaea werneckii]
MICRLLGELSKILLSLSQNGRSFIEMLLRIWPIVRGNLELLCLANEVCNVRVFHRKLTAHLVDGVLRCDPNLKRVVQEWRVCRMTAIEPSRAAKISCLASSHLVSTILLCPQGAMLLDPRGTLIRCNPCPFSLAV